MNNCDENEKNNKMDGEEKKMKLLSSPSSGCTARSNSVLNRNTKLYSPNNALDTSNTSSCFNSDAITEGNNVVFMIMFHRNVVPRKLKIQFQGGFSGLEFTVFSSSEKGNDEIMRMEFDADDTNEMQEFDFDENEGSSSTSFECSNLKIRFDESADFYGRITIYNLEVWGYE